MGKMIFVINDPVFCSNCPLAKSRKHNITKEERWYCGIRHQGQYSFEWIYEPIDMDSEIKPDWCPLKELPEKYEIDRSKCSDPFYEFEFEYGYNKCVDEILGK